MNKYFRFFSIRNLLVLVLIAFVFAYFSGSNNLPKHSSIAQININGLITTDQLRSEKIREMRKIDKIQENFVKEVEKLYGLNSRTLQRERNLGVGIPYVKIGKRVRYKNIDIEK